MASASQPLFKIPFEGLAKGGPSPVAEREPPRAVREPAPSFDTEFHSVDELNFSDMYLSVDNPEVRSFYRIGPNPEGRAGLEEVPDLYREHIATIRSQIEKHDKPDGILTVDNMRLRFRKAMMSDQTTRAALRRIPIDLPKLDDLAITPLGCKALRQWGRERGIVAIGGATGAGKTTTAVAMLNEYLSKLGGIAITIEDPPEYLMQGWVGDQGGHCDQLLIESDDEWETAVNTALRWRPRYILFGEIRTPEAAGQALRASTSGHLVLATVHGGSTDETLGNLLRLAEVKLGDGARKLLAHNLAGVIHQKLSRFGPDVSVLSLPRGGTEEAQIRKALSEGQFSAATHTKRYEADRGAS